MPHPAASLITQVCDVESLTSKLVVMLPATRGIALASTALLMASFLSVQQLQAAPCVDDLWSAALQYSFFIVPVSACVFPCNIFVFLIPAHIT